VHCTGVTGSAWLSLPQNTIAHARPTYLSRCAEFTGLSVKPDDDDDEKMPPSALAN